MYTLMELQTTYVPECFMTHITPYQKTRILYQNPLSTTNVVDYGVLTVHETNAPFPVTRHQFRMMCDKDILHLFFADLNQSTSPANQLPLYQLSKSAALTYIQYVRTVCYQDMLYWHSLTLEGGTDCLSQNVRTELPLYAAHYYHFMLHTFTTLGYTQLPLYAAHNYHFMLHTITTLCYTQLPLYATHN